MILMPSSPTLPLINGSKPATRARKASTIRIFFAYLYDQKIIADNPAIGIKTPKLGKRMPKYLSLEDSKKLLNVTYDDNDENKERDYAIITLFLNCGLRLSELVGINISNIDFSENRLTVIGKGNKERTIYLNNACVKTLKDYMSVRPTEGVKNDSKASNKALFLSKRKERIGNRTVQYIVDRELMKAGLDTSARPEIATTGYVGELANMPVYCASGVIWSLVEKYLGLAAKTLDDLSAIVVSGIGTGRALAFNKSIKVIDAQEGQGLLLQPKYRFGVECWDPLSVVPIFAKTFTNPVTADSNALYVRGKASRA